MPEEKQGATITDNVHQLAESSRQLFEAGKQITENLDQLSQRVEHASERTSEIARSPWLLAAVACAAGALLILFSRRS